jgi:maleylacetoacetate isomerase
MKLYDYWRSSAAYRVRIGLALKGLRYEQVSVHLTRGGGEHRRPDFRAVNPQARVPALQLDNGAVLIQSPAILEYLEQVHPNPPLLPDDAVQRAKVRAVAAVIGCDVHPLTNAAGTLVYLREAVKADRDTIKAWLAHWVAQGFTAVEALIEGPEFCFGSAPTLADVYLVPQVYSARRFEVPLDGFPKIVRIADHCAGLEPFRRAAPENQPDAE